MGHGSDSTEHAEHALRYLMVIEWSGEDHAYLVTLPDWASVAYQPVTHGATYIEAATKGMEVLEILVQGAQEDDGEMPAPHNFQPPTDDDGGNPFRGMIISDEDDDDALPYQERIARLMTGKDEDENVDYTASRHTVVEKLSAPVAGLRHSGHQRTTV